MALSAELATTKEQLEAAETLNRVLEMYVPGLLHVTGQLNPRAALAGVLAKVCYLDATASDFSLDKTINCKRLEAYLSQPFGRTVLQRCNANAHVVAGNGGVPHSAASLARRIYAINASLEKQQPIRQQRVCVGKNGKSIVSIYYWALDGFLNVGSHRSSSEVWNDEKLRAYLPTVRTPLQFAADAHLLHDFLSMHRVPVELGEGSVANYEREWTDLRDGK